MKNMIINYNGGFTLIEAVISLGILSIGILAMFSMQTLGVRGNASAIRISTQATWGADKIEQLISGEYKDVVNTSSAAIANDPKYTIAWTTADDTPLQDMKTVTMTVTSVVDGSRKVEMRQIKADEGAF